MAHQKRRSNTLEKAQARLSGLRSIDPTMNLGDGLSLQDYADRIAASGAQLQTYNSALAEADRTRIEFAETEASVAQLSSRILSAVVARYGKDSKEYEMAGGIPYKNYKRTKKVTSASVLTSSASPSAAASNGTASNGTSSEASARS